MISMQEEPKLVAERYSYRPEYGDHTNPLRHEQQSWRDWLRKNYKTEKEIWLSTPKKDGRAAHRIQRRGGGSPVLRLDRQHCQETGRRSHRPALLTAQTECKIFAANIERLQSLAAQKKVVKEVAGTLGDY